MTDINNPTNVIIGDDADELIRLGSVGAAAGFGGNDTIVSAINGVVPGSLIFGNTGNDYLESKGIGDQAFGGKDDDYIVNDTGQGTLSGDLGNDTLYGEEGLYTFFGGDGADYIRADEASSIFVGGDGNDTLSGGEGNDTMAGGDGNDWAKSGPEGQSFLFGNSGNDTLISQTTEANGDPDSVFAGRGDDYAYVSGSSIVDNPILVGDLGNDSLLVNGTSVDGAILAGDVDPSGQISGTDVGNDYLFVNGGNDHQLAGNAGNDTLELGAAGSNVTLAGGQGNDFLVGTANGEGLRAFGDRGDDYLYFSASSAQLWGDNPNATEFGDDTVIGVGGQITLAGDNSNAGTDGGNDFLRASGAGNNVLLGFAGNDTIDASASGSGDELSGGVGDDYYIFGAGDSIEADTDGINTYIGSGALDVTVTVQPTDSFGGDANFKIAGDQSNVRAIDSGGIISGDSPDLLTIGSANGLTNSGGGDDTLNVGNVTGSVNGGDGNDIISVTGTDGVAAGGQVDGGLGDDSIVAEVVAGSAVGGGGADTLALDSLTSSAVVTGGDGNDVFTIGTADAGASVDAGAGDEVLVVGGVGTVADPLSGAGVSLSGGAGDDTVAAATSATGTTGANSFLQGGDGNDFLQGQANGGDTLSGGGGNDTLFGGIATNSNIGVGTTTQFNFNNWNGDSLSGGAGADIFLFTDINQTGSTGQTLATVPAGSNAGQFGGLDATVQNILVYGGTNVGGTVNSAANVDTITGFSSTEDRLFFSTGGSFGQTTAGTLTNDFFSGTTDFSGLAGGTANTVPTVVGEGAGTTFFAAGTNIGAGDFFYDTTNGGLYTFYNTGGATRFALVSVLEGAPTLAAGDIQFGTPGASGFVTL